VDLAKFHVGARKMLNFFVHAQGGASNRAGTSYVGEVDSSTYRHRLIPFQFRSLPGGQTYALVFGNLTMQVVKNGAFVESSPGTRYTLATPYLAADLPLLKFVQSADVMTLTHSLYRQQKLTRTGDAAWTITPITFAPTQAAPTAFSSTGVGTTYLYGITAISGSNGEESLPLYGTSLSQTSKLTWTNALNGISYNIYKSLNGIYGFIGYSSDGTVGFTDTTIVPDVGDTPPQQRNPFGSNISAITKANPGAVTTIGAHGYTTGDTGYFDSVGGMVELNGNSYTLTVTGTTTFTIGVNTSGYTTYTSGGTVQGPGDFPICSTYYLQRQVFAGTLKKPDTLWFSNVGAFNNMSVAVPTKDSDAITRTLVSREVNAIRHLVPMTSMLAMTSGSEWRVYPGGTASALTPAQCTTLPQTYLGCSDNCPPIIADNSVLFVQGKGSRVIALKYDAIQDLYDSKDMSVLSQQVLWDTLAQYTLDEWAWAQEPFRIVWGVRSDGYALGFTYMREHDVYAWHRHNTQGTFESVCAITEGDEATAEAEDTVYWIVNRTINGATKRYVERMVSRTFEDVTEEWFVDCGLQYDGWNTDATKTLKVSGASYAAGATVTMTAAGFTPFTNPASIDRYYKLRSDDDEIVVQVSAYTSTSVVSATLLNPVPASLQNVVTDDWALMATSVSGLSHLEGETVSILGDGSVVPEAVVTSGAVTLDAYYARVTVGLGYTADLETLNLELAAAGGTIQGEMKKIAQITTRVKDTRGIEVGIGQFNRRTGQDAEPALVEIKQRGMENLGDPMSFFSGDFATVIPTEWNREGWMYIRQRYPLGCTILDLVPEVNVGS